MYFETEKNKSSNDTIEHLYESPKKRYEKWLKWGFISFFTIIVLIFLGITVSEDVAGNINIDFKSSIYIHHNLVWVKNWYEKTLVVYLGVQYSFTIRVDNINSIFAFKKTQTRCLCKGIA